MEWCFWQLYAYHICLFTVSLSLFAKEAIAFCLFLNQLLIVFHIIHASFLLTAFMCHNVNNYNNNCFAIFKVLTKFTTSPKAEDVNCELTYGEREASIHLAYTGNNSK